MLFLIGILAGLGAFAVSSRAGAQGNVMTLVRAVMPFSGPVIVGSVVSLLAQNRDISGPLPPFAFKVRVVGVPDGGTPNFTGLFLSDVLGAKTGEFLEFSIDKIQNVETA